MIKITMIITIIASSRGVKVAFYFTAYLNVRNITSSAKWQYACMNNMSVCDCVCCVLEFSYAKHICNEKLRVAKMFMAIMRDV